MQIKAFPLLLGCNKTNLNVHWGGAYYDLRTTKDLFTWRHSFLFFFLDESKTVRVSSGCGEFVSYSNTINTSKHQGASCLSNRESEFEEKLKRAAPSQDIFSLSLSLHESTGQMGRFFGNESSTDLLSSSCSSDVGNIFIKL